MNQNTKKVVIVVHHYPPHITGVGMVAHNQAKRLVATGYGVTVITSDTGEQEKNCIMDGVEVVRIKALNISEEKWNAPFPIFSLRIFPILAKHIKSADIVHIHDAFYMSSFLAALYGRLYRKPIVLTQHIALVTHPSRFIMQVQKLVYATTGSIIFHFSHIIFQFNDHVKQLLIQYRVPESKIRTLLNGVDINFFYPVDVNEKKPLKEKFGLILSKKSILFVGRFVPKKGFDKMLAAQSEKYQIVFVGGEPLSQNNKNVIFLGKLDQKKLAEVYRAADIFVLPSESEGFPLSIQEAMACGLPIITTNDDGYKSYNFDRKMIDLLDKPSRDSIYEAINSIIHNEVRIKEMSEYSRNYAVTNFSWNLIMQKLINTYKELMQISVSSS